MAKFLWQVSYTTEGIKGLVKEGGSSRAKAIKKLTEAHGGKLEAFYFAFGDDDVYLIAELPSNLEASAISLAVAASGAARIKTVVLLEPSQVDAAAKVKVGYRAPGA
ncbi:MAG: GYD domain-containing protein [Candidatus Limnocylindrales bacterium]